MKKKPIEYPVFSFEIKDILKHLTKIEDEKQKIIYLKYVIKEWQNLEEEKIFIKKLKRELNFLEDITGLNYNPTISKINWIGNKQDLIYFFDELINNKMIPYTKNIDQLIASHFTIKDEEIHPEKNRFIRHNLKNSIQQPGDVIQKILK